MSWANQLISQGQKKGKVISSGHPCNNCLPLLSSLRLPLLRNRKQQQICENQTQALRSFYRLLKPVPLPITPWMEWVLWKYSTRTSPLQHSWSTLLFSRSARYYTSMSWSTLCFPEVLSITLLWVEAPTLCFPKLLSISLLWAILCKFAPQM